jgi:hypothetical protein
VSVSPKTQDRYDAAKERLDRARAAVLSANSELIDAERQFNAASKAWGYEYFGAAGPAAMSDRLLPRPTAEAE